MKLKIAAIISPPIEHMMQSLVPELAPYCSLTPIVAKSNPEARMIYERIRNEFDAIVFGGRIFMTYATRNNSSSQPPCFSFEDMPGSLSDVLYRLLRDNRDFDFSRVSIDIMLSYKDPMGFLDLFPEDQRPYCIDESFPIFSLDDVTGEGLTQMILKWHLQLYNSGQTDYVITRFGAIVSDLEEAGAPFAYVAPSKEYIINFLLQVVSSLSIQKAEDQMLGVIILRSFAESADENALLLSRWSEELTSCARLNGYDFSFRRTVNTLEVITRYKDLSLMTQRFLQAPFGDMPKNVPGASPMVGLGTGGTLFQARLNALNAVSMAGRPEEVYYVSYDNKVFGPLGESSGSMDLVPSEKMIALSNRLQIDHFVLQKLHAYTQARGLPTVTAQELAQYLEVSRRTANRILVKLVKGSVAHVYEENINRGKGRPRLQYDLTLLREMQGL